MIACLYRHFTSKRLLALASICVVWALSSCQNTRKMVLFKELSEDTTLAKVVQPGPEPVITQGDLLSIKVTSLSPDNTVLYNNPPNMEGEVAGYKVDESGSIEFVKLGRLMVAGMTRKQLKDTLQDALSSQFLSQPVVAIGFLNRHITLIGSAGPKVLPMTSGNMTLLDALASGGDATTTGRSDNVLVIRQQDSSKVFKRIDLRDGSLFHSPYYYMQPNDIVYVEQNKKAENNWLRIFSYVTSGISLVILIITRVF